MRNLKWHIGDVIRKIRGTTSVEKLGLRGGTVSELERRGNSYNFEQATLVLVVDALNATLKLKPPLTVAELYQLVPVFPGAGVTPPVTPVLDDRESWLLDRFRAMTPQEREAVVTIVVVMGEKRGTSVDRVDRPRAR